MVCSVPLETAPLSVLTGWVVSGGVTVTSFSFSVLSGPDGLAPLLEVFAAEAALPSAHAASLQSWCDTLAQATHALAQDAAQDAELPARAAEDYLRLVGTVALAYTWCRAARVAQALDPAHPAHTQKREGARYFFDYVLPGAAHWLRLVQAARHPVAPV